MYIILGATGHVGSSVAKHLLHAGEPVTIVTHDPDKRADWEPLGAKVAVVDVHDTEALALVFKTGRRLFLLNPPAPIDSDTVAEEKRSLACILEAVKAADFEKVVAESTAGAQPGDGIGDLGVLFEMEQALRAIGVPTSINRAAYYFSNWDHALETAREAGEVHTLYPADFKLPMVAPEDLGATAARLLRWPPEKFHIRYVEGTQDYSSQDVADAFSHALGKPVRVVVTPKDRWRLSLEQQGFSKPAAESMARMTVLTLASDFKVAEEVVRGPTSLQAYIQALVERSSS
jgi:uncharacterized protein YbjT (DUF2867 family)